MKKLIITVLLAALAFAVINDLGRYLIAMYSLDDGGRTAVFEAAKVAETNPSANSGWPAAWQVAQDRGFEITGYTQDSTGVVAVCRIWVGGTFIIGPAYALLTRQALGTPLPLQQTVRSQ